MSIFGFYVAILCLLICNSYSLSLFSKGSFHNSKLVTPWKAVKTDQFNEIIKLSGGKLTSPRKIKVNILC